MTTSPILEKYKGKSACSVSDLLEVSNGESHTGKPGSYIHTNSESRKAIRLVPLGLLRPILGPTGNPASNTTLNIMLAYSTNNTTQMTFQHTKSIAPRTK